MSTLLAREKLTPSEVYTRENERINTEKMSELS